MQTWHWLYHLFVCCSAVVVYLRWTLMIPLQIRCTIFVRWFWQFSMIPFALYPYRHSYMVITFLTILPCIVPYTDEIDVCCCSDDGILVLPYWWPCDWTVWRRQFVLQHLLLPCRLFTGSIAITLTPIYDTMTMRVPMWYDDVPPLILSGIPFLGRYWYAIQAVLMTCDALFVMWHDDIFSSMPLYSILLLRKISIERHSKSWYLLYTKTFDNSADKLPYSIH